MGASFASFASSSKQLKMKFQVVVLALVSCALAEPEADAGYFYNRYYSHPSYYNRGLYGYGYPRYGYHGYHGLYKRQVDLDALEAEPCVAEPCGASLVKREADAYFYGNYYNQYAHYPYYNNYANAYYAPYHYAVGGCRNSYGAVTPCA